MMRHPRMLATLLFVVSLTLALSAQELPPGSNTTLLKALKEDGPAKALDAMRDLPSEIVRDPFLVNHSMAIAAVHRALFQLSSDEQYEILNAWTLPADGAVRVLTSLAPESGPPMEFARAIGERPKKESFGTASIGSVPGLFCSAWMLVTTADESGNLRKLITELESRSAKQAANADFVLALAKIRDSRSSVDELRLILDARAKEEGSSFSARMEKAVLLAAATQRADMAGTLEPLAEKQLQVGAVPGNVAATTFLRRLRAIAILKSNSPEADATAILRETPPLWIAASDPRDRATATGSDQALWLTHEDHVQKLSGPGDDLLLFRYPLMGKFELKGEVSVFEEGIAGLTYGGQSFDATDQFFTVRELMRPHQQARIWPFVAAKEFRMFNRINIRSDGQKVVFLSNLHPGASFPMTACAASPWLGLQGSGSGRLYFRNLEIVGEPEIPREVSPIQDSALRGWTTPLGESLIRSVEPLLADPTAPKARPVDPDAVWTVKEGVLESQRVEASEGTRTQRMLTWMRPVLEGETLRYEFFYDEEKSMVHPALGRMAFLMEPGGVRIRWVTTGASWTGLEPDHGVIEPLNRKGPRMLPLKPADWNSVSLMRQDGKLQITLNDIVIYLRPVTELPSHQPGFYHEAEQGAARIRNVKLIGGSTWPEKLTAEQLRDPVAFAPATK